MLHVLALLLGCVASQPVDPSEHRFAFLAPANAGDPADCEGVPSSWSSDWAGSDVVAYPRGLEADRDRAARGVQQVRAAVANAVGVPAEVVPPATVWLVTQSQRVRDGSALTITSHGDIAVFLYAPSCSADPRPRQFERTIAQELAGLYLDAKVRQQGRWAFYAAPAWFIQGSEEWVARLAHEAVTDVQATADARARSSPPGAVAARGGSLSAADPYRDGEAVVAWLVLREGPDVLHRILVSQASTFDGALTDATSMSPSEVAEQYAAWRGDAKE